MKKLMALENITLKIAHTEEPILKDINYEILQGDFLIVVGSNGSGKSSLLKLMDRRYHAAQGKIFFENKSLDKFNPKDLSKKIITLTQNYHDSLFTSLTLFENYILKKEHASFFLNRKKEKKFFAEYIAQFNPKLAKKLDQMVESLSGGEKQALALALSILHPPELLLLDEHTSALDPNSAKQIMELTNNLVKENHITCVLTTHDLDIAIAYGNKMIALRHGEIYRVFDEVEKKKMKHDDLLKLCY